LSYGAAVTTSRSEEWARPNGDLIATRLDETVYVQVATTIAASEETRRREYAPLEAINDNFPKYVVTLDPTAGDNSGGIRHLRIPEFLLADTY